MRTPPAFLITLIMIMIIIIIVIIIIIIIVTGGFDMSRRAVWWRLFIIDYHKTAGMLLRRVLRCRT